MFDWPLPDLPKEECKSTASLWDVHSAMEDLRVTIPDMTSRDGLVFGFNVDKINDYPENETCT